MNMFNEDETQDRIEIIKALEALGFNILKVSDIKTEEGFERAEAIHLEVVDIDDFDTWFEETYDEDEHPWYRFNESHLDDVAYDKEIEFEETIQSSLVASSEGWYTLSGTNWEVYGEITYELLEPYPEITKYHHSQATRYDPDWFDIEWEPEDVNIWYTIKLRKRLISE